MTNFKQVLKKYSSTADIIRKIVMFLQNNPEIIEALQDMSPIEAVACILYAALMVWIWKEFIRENYPILYACLSKMAT